MMLFTDYLWDFDGTLFDTYPGMARAYREAILSLGGDATYEETLAQIKRSIGRAAAHFAENAPFAAKELVARFQQTRNDAHLPAYPGAREICARVRAAGGRNFLYSHRDQTALDALRENGMDGLFTGMILSTDPFPSKPAPDAILYLAEKYGIDKSRAVMVGDRDIDVRAGENAGVAGLLFDPDGFYPDFQTKYRAKDFPSLARLCEIP